MGVTDLLCGAIFSAAIQETFSQQAQQQKGYRSDFLGSGVDIPLPGGMLAKDTLMKPENLNFDETGAWRNYRHHSIATHKTRRQPTCVALNIDATQLKTTSRGEWKIDPEIGADYQLDNSYYRNNEWDRGHLARRSAAAWGATIEDAREASDDTMYYSNACLQHENLNQDEWKALEDWVLVDLGADRVSVFSGPMYGGLPTPRYIGSPPAEIPSGFFKIVCFLDANRELATRAFVYLQDDEALRDKLGYTRNNYMVYQVPTSRIEDETGLVFPAVLTTSNPVTEESIQLAPPTVVDNSNNDSNDGAAPLVGTPIDSSRCGGNNKPCVFVAAALINPSGGNECGREWISLANYGPGDIDLDGWTLEDQATSRKPLQLYGRLVSGKTLKLTTLKDNSGGSIILTNSGGKLTLKDSDGIIVNAVEWTKGIRDGEVTVFGFK